jgi:hypothetical protein
MGLMNCLFWHVNGNGFLPLDWKWVRMKTESAKLAIYLIRNWGVDIRYGVFSFMV